MNGLTKVLRAGEANGWLTVYSGWHVSFTRNGHKVWVTVSRSDAITDAAHGDLGTGFNGGHAWGRGKAEQVVAWLSAPADQEGE